MSYNALKDLLRMPQKLKLLSAVPWATLVLPWFVCLFVCLFFLVCLFVCFLIMNVEFFLNWWMRLTTTCFLPGRPLQLNERNTLTYQNSLKNPNRREPYLLVIYKRERGFEPHCRVYRELCLVVRTGLAVADLGKETRKNE